MNESIIAVIYGVIQGITEFLPVSSSGHLALIPYFLGAKDPGVFFDLSMHLGTALAVLISFRAEVRRLIDQSFLITNSAESVFARNFYIASLVTVFCVFGLKGVAENYGRSPNMIAFNLVFFGLLMWLCDYLGKSNHNLMKSPGYLRAALIGVSQSLAIFPGVSRSGITLSSSRLLGLSREDAASFSFLLSLPIIIGGFFYKLLGLYQTNAIHSIQWHSVFIGITVSFLVGLLAIKFFMKLLSKVGLWVYFWYRLALAAIILLF